jgi:phosphatidylglycerophosphate synthase
MPEPSKKNYSLDKYIYSFINQLPKSYCILEPNQITLFNYLISFLVLYLFYYDKSIIIIILLAIFRSFLDILDGAIARNCNKYSDLGDKLDHYGDIIYNLFLILIIYFKIKNKIYLLVLVLILFILNYIFTYKNINETSNIIMYNNIMHDNTILFYPLIILFTFYYKK